MSSLTSVDKLSLEIVLGMEKGFVLDFSDVAFKQFFENYHVDIHGSQYQVYGTSKTNKMREFWVKEPDDLVAQVLSDLLDVCETLYSLKLLERDSVAFNKSREIVARLFGITPEENSLTKAVDLKREFEIPNIEKLPVDPDVSRIIQERLTEAQACLPVGAYLSVIFLCGSVLEAALLGVAKNKPREFNQSRISPKDQNGNVKKLWEWNLAQLIDVACDIGLLKLDSSKFSHILRDFRNYIHPEQQLKEKFKPDKITSLLCYLALLAALADLSSVR